jgi:DNA-binding NarL/FixJ family response regulator
MIKIYNSLLRLMHKSPISWSEFKSLTKQEKAVLDLLSQGFSTKQIAEQLYISSHTVSTHRKNIYTKTGCSNVVKLVNYNNAIKLLGLQ